MATASNSIQIFGHSFVRRLRQFISEQPDLKFNLNLESKPLVQYSGFPGATVRVLHDKLEHISDFSPSIVVLVVGTNDLYNRSTDIGQFCDNVMTLIDIMLNDLKVKRVIFLQIVHRTHSDSTRYPVDLSWFNARVDEANNLLQLRIKSSSGEKVTFWRLKGLSSYTTRHTGLSNDGTHLSRLGQRKLFNNIRAAVVASLNTLTQ